MAASEHHGMGHQAVPKHQSGRLVHAGLNLVSHHQSWGEYKPQSLPLHQRPADSRAQSGLRSLVLQHTLGKQNYVKLIINIGHLPLFDTSHPNQTGSLAEIESFAISINSSTGWLLYTTRRPPTWVGLLGLCLIVSTYHISQAIDTVSLVERICWSWITNLGNLSN